METFMGQSRAIATIVIERDEVIRARREALRRMAGQPDRERKRIHLEFFQPLNERLLALNKELGI
jgi:hypothetical protein